MGTAAGPKLWGGLLLRSVALAPLLVLGDVGGLSAGESPAPTRTEALGPDLVVKTLRRGFVLHVSKDAEGTSANGLIVETPAGPVIIDAGWTEDQARRLMDWAERAMGRPVVEAIITHAHPDRMGGVGAVYERGIRASALDLTVSKVRETEPKTPLAVLFTAAARIHKDPRGFEAFYPGPGHTKDNIVVFFPKEGILFAGCLLKAETAEAMGFVGDADGASWPKAVGAVQARYPKVELVVPGHGEPGGPGAFVHTLDLLHRAFP